MSKTFEPYHELTDEDRKLFSNIVFYNTTEECIKSRLKDYKEFSLNELENLVPDFRVDVYYISNTINTLYIGILKYVTKEQLIFDDIKIDISSVKQVFQLLIKV